MTRRIGFVMTFVGLALVGCGGGSGTTDLAMPAGNKDLAMAPSPDLTVTVGPDMATPAAAPDMTTPPSGADMMIVPMCTSPADCMGNPCCLSVQMSMLAGLTCSAKMSDCAPMLDFSGSGQTRVCTKDADCTSGLMNSNLPTCCTGMKGGSKIHLCFSAGLAAFSMGQVTCP